MLNKYSHFLLMISNIFYYYETLLVYNKNIQSRINYVIKKG